MTFADAIGLRRGDVLALVGAGGKTALTLLLGIEMLSSGEPVACCATTMTLLPAPDPRIRAIYTREEDAAQAVGEALRAGQLPWVAGEPSAERDLSPEARGGVVSPIALTDAKVKGAAPSKIDRLHAALPDVTLIAEADGARHRWLKAPADHEPQLPACTTALSPVAHLGVIGKPLAGEFVHRPERVARILGVPIGTTLTAKMVADVLTHEEGGLKGWRTGVRAVPILTLPSADSSADAVAGALLSDPGVSRVVVAWLGQNPWARAIRRVPCHSERSEESPAREAETLRFAQSARAQGRQVAGVLLAAGGSARFGQPKQLLPFGGRTLVEHALDILLRSLADEILVVLGARAEQIAPLVQGPRVRIVRNPDWEQGQSTSVRAAVNALTPDCDAAVFLPCDMPWIAPAIIGELIRAWQQTGKPLVVTAAAGRRGIPALFARETFAELRGMSGDQGGRGWLHKHPDLVAEVVVESDLLADIDTPEEYQRALEQFKRKGNRE